MKAKRGGSRGSDAVERNVRDELYAIVDRLRRENADLAAENERLRSLPASPACESAMASVVSLVAAERARQIAKEGWTPEHDDEHSNGALALAASCYAEPHAEREIILDRPAKWPWAREDWKPTPNDRIRELVKAGALIVAEIERLQRAALRPSARGTHEGTDTGEGGER